MATCMCPTQCHCRNPVTRSCLKISQANENNGKITTPPPLCREATLCATQSSRSQVNSRTGEITDTYGGETVQSPPASFGGNFTATCCVALALGRGSSPRKKPHSNRRLLFGRELRRFKCDRTSDGRQSPGPHHQTWGPFHTVATAVCMFICKTPRYMRSEL